MRSGRGHVAIVKKLGLQRLGLLPVARGRSTVTNWVVGHRQGALTIPRRLCDRKPEVPHLLGQSFAWSLEHINYSYNVIN